MRSHASHGKRSGEGVFGMFLQLEAEHAREGAKKDSGDELADMLG